MKTVKPTQVVGTFYELPSYQAEVFANFYPEMIRRSYGIAVVEYRGQRYIAASDGWTAIFYPCDESMECGDYEGLPFMRKATISDKMQRSLTNLLKMTEEFTTYDASMFPGENEDLDNFDPFNYHEYTSKASLEGTPVLLGKVVDGKFVIDDKGPVVQAFNEEKLTFIGQSIGSIDTIKAGKPHQAILLCNKSTGVMALLMPMATNLGKMVVFKS